MVYCAAVGWLMHANPDGPAIGRWFVGETSVRCHSLAVRRIGGCECIYEARGSGLIRLGKTCYENGDIMKVFW